MIDYARKGQGTDKMSAVEGGATKLGDHSADWGDNTWRDNGAIYALTRVPFYTSGSRYCSVDVDDGNPNRWECDDIDVGGGGDYDTIHRIWVQ